jgi:hypothetical protein
MNRSILIAATALLLSLAACKRLGPSRSYQVLGDTPAAVRTAFNADEGKVRVLMLVSPTCGACLNGASEVSEQLLKIERGNDTAVYVVWVPRLGAHEKDVSSATQVVGASWAHQYWDGGDLLGDQYKQVLGWNGNAWDVYLLYGTKTKWAGDLPPTPDFFMHQTSEKGPRLDETVFGTRIKQLLTEQQ